MAKTYTTKEIVIYGQNFSVSNKELEKEIGQMLKASTGLQASTWKFAIAAHNIIANELYKDDFKDVKTFAKAMHVKDSLLSRYKKAVECMTDTLSNAPYNYSMDTMTVGKAYVLSTLGEDLVVYLDSMIEQGAHIELMSQAQLEDSIKKFKDRDVVETDGSSDNEGSGAGEGSEKAWDENIKACVEDGFLYISINSKLYSIPADELEEYRVK